LLSGAVFKFGFICQFPTFSIFSLLPLRYHFVVKKRLDNIRNSDSVHFVMINGRLYDANTMDQIGNHPTKRGKFYWEE
jgi:hypothetical protein